MEKKPLSLDVEINVDDEKLNEAIEKTDRLIESLREANRLIRELNGIRDKAEHFEEKEGGLRYE